MAKRIEHCKDCGQHERAVGELSRKHLCGECGIRRAMAAAADMRNRSGPYYEAWLRSPAKKPGQPAPRKVR